MSRTDRPSFRHRLLITVGSALALALIILSILVWLGLYTWLHVDAHDVLDREARFIQSQIITPGGQLRPNRYHWDEPHHRFSGPHIDPVYVQVFGSNRRVIRQSDNVSLFPGGAYPERLLATEDASNRLIPHIRTFSVGDQLLYYVTRPLQNERGETLGYLQVARREPGIGARMKQAALVLAAGLIGVLLALGLLVWWQAGRVLRPLATITGATESITPHELSRRIPTPPEADRETAQLAATMNDQLVRLEHAFEEMYRFTANAAHELQTPLTVLRGHVDVTLRRIRSPEEYQKTLTLLGHEIDKLTRMVRSLLTLARLDREARLLPDESVDLVEVVKTESESYERAARSKGLDFKLELPDSAWVRVQPELLREVAANVLDNAVKYTLEGYLQVQVDRDGDHVQLTVRDTGIGMTDEDSARATDRFYRASSVDALDIPGSGLGLSLAAQIVARHGGELRIDSVPTEGTCVCIRLPGTDGRHE